jgi:octaprenyl-diphosphate synthase
LPVILAYARGSADDRAFWRSAIAGERTADQDLERAGALLRDSGALSETVERARLYGRRALDALAPFPAGRARAALAEAVEFAIRRAY